MCTFVDGWSSIFQSCFSFSVYRKNVCGKKKLHKTTAITASCYHMPNCRPRNKTKNHCCSCSPRTIRTYAHTYAKKRTYAADVERRSEWPPWERKKKERPWRPKRGAQPVHRARVWIARRITEKIVDKPRPRASSRRVGEKKKPNLQRDLARQSTPPRDRAISASRLSSPPTTDDSTPLALPGRAGGPCVGHTRSTTCQPFSHMSILRKSTCRL